MPEADTSTFSCSACGKQYKWKQELAGRKVKCKCGAVVHIPATDPAGSAPEEEESPLSAMEEMAATKQVEIPRQDDDLYAMAEPEKPKKPVRAAAVASAGAAAPSPMLGYSRAPVADARDANDPNAMSELYLPIGVFAVGLILAVVQAMKFNIITFPFQTALAYVGIRLIFDMVLISVGCLAVMSWLEVSFGSPGPALLKIAAIALIASPVADITSYVVHDPFGLIGRIVSMVVIWLLFMKLFDMDISDVRILAGIVWLVRVWAGYILLGLIFSGMGIGFAGLGGPRMADAELNSDRLVREQLDMGRMIDAKPWLEDTNHCFGRTPNVPSKKLVDGLLAAGCKMVQIEHSGPYASELVAELPSGDAPRKAAFDAAAVFCNETGDTTPRDKGQTYLVMGFSMYYEPPPSTAPGSTPPGGATPRMRRRYSGGPFN